MQIRLKYFHRQLVELFTYDNSRFDNINKHVYETQM